MMVMIVFSSAFRLEMHRNNFFKKNIFDISISKRSEKKKLNRSKEKKIIFLKTLLKYRNK
jgi:hypothetical protein